MHSIKCDLPTLINVNVNRGLSEKLDELYTVGQKNGVDIICILRTVVGNRPTRNLRHLAVCNQNQQNLRSLPREPHFSVPTVPLDFTLLNLRSSNNKGDQVVKYVTDNDLDVVALTETWVQKDDSVARGNLTPAGYTIYDELRLQPKKQGKWKKGGGVGILCKSSLTVIKVQCFSAKTFEFINVLISSGTKSARQVFIYRPPSKFHHTVKLFLGEFASLLESMALDNSNIFIAGDFNIHMENPTNRTGTAAMEDLLAVNGLNQYVCGPTQRSGHTLDFLHTRVSETTASSVRVCDPGLPDHKAVTCCLHISKPPAVRKQVSVRKYKSLRRDLAACRELHSLPGNFETAAQQYDCALGVIMDQYAPKKTKTVTV